MGPQLIYMKRLIITFCISFVSLTFFSQSKDFEKKYKSGLYKFTFDSYGVLNRTVADVIKMATENDYDFLKTENNSIIFKGPLSFNKIILKRKIKKRELFLPKKLWLGGTVYKEIIFVGDKFENEYVQATKTSFYIPGFNSSDKKLIDLYFDEISNYLTYFIKKHHSINSKDFIYNKSFGGVVGNIPVSELINFDYSDDVGLKRNAKLSFGKTKSENYNNSRLTPYYLAISLTGDVWELAELYSESLNNKSKSIKYLRDNIGDKNLEEINTYDLTAMVDFFLSDCKRAGLNVPGIETLDASFIPFEDETLAIALGMNDDSKITLRVDPAKWEKASKQKKWYIIYHELGHDVFNLKHGQGGKMMFNFADRDYTWDEFYSDRDYMIKYIVENKN